MPAGAIALFSMRPLPLPLMQRDAVDVGAGRGVVTGQGAVAVLEAEEGGLDAVLLGDQVAHACPGDQFLAFEHATEQQADDDQHDGDFDQGEAFGVAHHLKFSIVKGESRLGLRKTADAPLGHRAVALLEQACGAAVSFAATDLPGGRSGRAVRAVGKGRRCEAR